MQGSRELSYSSRSSFLEDVSLKWNGFVGLVIEAILLIDQGREAVLVLLSQLED